MNSKLEKDLQKQLRDSEENIDVNTRTKLREARNRATAATGQAESPWLQNWIPAAAVASIVALATLIAVNSDNSEAPDLSQDMVSTTEPGSPPLNETVPLMEFEASLLLAADAEELLQPQPNDISSESEDGDDMLDLYENLEFYEWLLLEDLDETAS